MRVAIIISHLSQLGPVKVMQTLVNSICEAPELNIRVFYLDKKTDHEVKLLVPVERLVRSNFCFEDYDIIHTNGIRPDLFARVNRKKIKCHISTIHNFVFEDLFYSYNKLISLIFGNLWLLLWRRADKLVCVSAAMKTYYEKWFPSTKLEVIYNGISENENNVKPENDIIQVINGFRSKGLTVIGTAGILTRRKGIDQVLYLIEKEKSLALIIIGDGKELNNLQSLAKKLKVSDRCFFCGFRGKAVNYFTHFDFLIVPSRSEGFGLVLTEAVQQKVPVICSDIPVFKELFNEEEVSFFKLEDIDSLASAFRKASESDSKKASIAYIKYQNNYTAGQMAKHYLALYKNVS